MKSQLVQLEIDGHVATVALNDPEHRNALGTAMFDALEETLVAVERADGVHVVLLHGRGRVFCAGFDLKAAARDPALMGRFIKRLSLILRDLRRLPQVVVGAVQGAAIAGGCAIVSACDLVVVSATARLGYPVHGLGVSPAVSIATLQQSIGPGPARALLVGGELIDGRAAFRLGLASHLCDDDAGVRGHAAGLCGVIAGHGPHALRTTKAWLNELDGSLDDRRFEPPAQDTARLADTPEARARLAEHVKKMRD